MQKQARKVFAIECDATDITGLRSIGSPTSGEDDYSQWTKNVCIESVSRAIRFSSIIPIVLYRYL